MKKKNLLIDVAQKMKKIRDIFGLSSAKMIENIKTHKSTYYNYESGKAFPHFTVLYKLGNSMDISLDWLILNKGPMIYKQKDIENNTLVNPLDMLPPDIKEMVENMQRTPLLKYELLLAFHQYKENHKELLDSTTQKKGESS